MPDRDPAEENSVTSAVHGAGAPAGGKPGPGVKLGGRYRLERELGRGAVGVVWLARDEQLNDRPVVVKVLLEHSREKGEWYTKKFHQEREALARLDHPGVVGVLDAGEMADGNPYLVMQYVDGVTLRQVIERGPLGLRRTAKIARQIGRALEAAHQKGIYHKDLKPENIMLQDLGGGNEAVKIIDFGIASLRDLDTDGMAADQTQYTRVAGSAAYMAPEQMLGKPGASSDIYSFGIVTYEMLTGKMPFEAASLTEVFAKQQEGVKVRPEQVRADLPAAAGDCVLRALEFDAGKRWGSAREFGEALAQGLDRRREEAAGGGRRKVLAGVIVGVGLLALLPMAVSNLRAPERSFQYSIVAQRMSQGQPWGEPFVLPGEMIFQSDFRVKLRVSAPQPGYLYVFGGARQFVNSVRLAANQDVEALGERWIAFGTGAGVERVWLVWSAEALADAGKMLGKEQAAAARDEAAGRTVVRGRGKVLVRLVEIEHH